MPLALLAVFSMYVSTDKGCVNADKFAKRNDGMSVSKELCLALCQPAAKAPKSLSEKDRILGQLVLDLHRMVSLNRPNHDFL